MYAQKIICMYIAICVYVAWVIANYHTALGKFEYIAEERQDSTAFDEIVLPERTHHCLLQSIAAAGT